MQNYSCPVCDAQSRLFDVVDFNRNCAGLVNEKFPVSGIPIYYSICTECDFLFAPEFWNWKEKEYIERIYNSDYVYVDPEYLDIRSKNQAELLEKLFGNFKDTIRHIDYGGGKGGLSKSLVSMGWNSISYDPFGQIDGKNLNDLGAFNLITAFEVFEHVPKPHDLMKNIKNLMEDECLVFFSTGIHDGNVIKDKRLDWWYVAPRNGHISIYSSISLKKLAEKFILNYGSLGPSYQCYWNKFPTWAKILTTKEAFE